MNATITIAIIAAVIIIAIAVAWILTSNKARATFQNELNLKAEELGRKETEVRTLTGLVAERDANLIRKDADVRTAEALRESERKQHEQAMAEIKASHEKALSELKAGQEKAIEAAKTALALENEKILKAREETLKKEAAETMKAITGGLDQNIKDMKDAFEAQKKSHAEETSSIKTQFAETVKHLKEQTENIGARRLHTILERLLEDISFNMPDMETEKVVIDRDYVKEIFEEKIHPEDIDRFIL